MIKALPGITKLLNFLLVLSLAALVTGYLKFEGLPPPKNILSALQEEPEQLPLNKPAFTFHYEGSSYQLEPRADYLIRGLVATHNNVSSIGDAYHTSKSVDLKDICLIWGENATNQHLKKIEFWSEPWTCFFKTSDDQAYQSFAFNKLSNNHLLASTPSVKKIIQKVRVGDQIEMRGQLVDYYPHGASEQVRKTSLTRNDTGNGACEVFYVEDISILERWKPFYNELYWNGKFSLMILLVLKFISFLAFPWLEYKFS